MPSSLETWVRTNFWGVLSYDICRAIWTCLASRHAVVEVKEGDRTRADDLSGGLDFNSEILAKLLAEKEGKKFMSIQQAYEQVKVKHPILMRKDVHGPAGWVMENPDPVSRQISPLVVRPGREAEWGISGPPFIYLPDPRGGDPFVIPGHEKEAEEWEAHDTQAQREAQELLNDLILQGKIQYRTDTFTNCSQPSDSAMNTVAAVIQKTVKILGNNIPDDMKPSSSQPTAGK